MNLSVPAGCGLLALALAAAAGDARAETYNTCAGFITVVPTTITTQGVWCMDRDLASSLSSGALITIATNNVTIDCNDFKLGGLAAGPGTATIGILAIARANTTVRRCNIRGFLKGISLDDIASNGARIVENRFDGNTSMGIQAVGTGHTIRGNLIVDTGGSTSGGFSYGIQAFGDSDILDNTIDGVVHAAVMDASGSVGIGNVGSHASVVAGNRVRNVDGGPGIAYGIAAYVNFIEITDNHISTGEALGVVVSLACNGPNIVSGNHVFAFGTASGCDDDGGNIIKP